MLVTAVIIAFVLGAITTLLAQFWFVRRWLSYQSNLKPPYKQQHPRVQLPPSIFQCLSSFYHPPASSKESSGKTPSSVTKDYNLILNVLTHFLFAELKDTARVRRWMSRKLNVEFEEMLASTTGKFMNQIQVRDFSLGDNFPLIEALELKEVQLSKDRDTIEKVDVALRIDYSGGFELTLDVDVIFGAWAYLFIKVSKLSGLARLQLTRVPFTHWSFSFYDEPVMEFEVDSRFNGRPIPQISSLIINQIKRLIRKKHILPSYKMRYKPLFIKPEEFYVNPDLSFHGNRLGRGHLVVKVLRCSRLPELSKDSKIYCTLSIDKEDMEEVWRKSWQTVHISLKISPNIQLGLALKDQLSGEKTEKKRVVVDNIISETPAAEAGLRKGDIIEYINNVRVLSCKHASKQLKNSVESASLQVKRHKNRLSMEAADDFTIQEQQIDLEVDEQYFNGDNRDDEFVTISFKDSTSKSSSASLESTGKTEPQKFSEKVTRKLQSGKRKVLGMTTNGRDSGLESSVEESPFGSRVSIGSKGSASDLGKTSAVKGLDSGKGSIGYKGSGEKGSIGSKENGESVTDGPVVSTLSTVKDGSHSATSSPQRQVKGENRQRALSDTSLHRTSDSDGSSLLSDLGNYGYLSQDRRAGEVCTRELNFSNDPEWNEEFEFDCREEDQFVNVCVWCRMKQADRPSKQSASSASANMQKTEPNMKNTPPVDDLQFYNITTKIGYVSIPLSDVTAGCLLTLQGDTQYTVYLQSPEETITATQPKLAYCTHPGFDRSICQGDITLSFMHTPFKAVEKAERKVLVTSILNPKPVKTRSHTAPKESTVDGLHEFKPCHFQSATYCDFCGKKIWLKGGMQCQMCSMVCHKKCVEKCQFQTKCTTDGPKNALKPEEAWVAPARGRANTDIDKEDKDSAKTSNIATGKFWKNFKSNKDNQPSLPLNIPNKQPKVSPTPSPSRSPMRSPSPFTAISLPGDSQQLSVTGVRKNSSAKSLSALDKDDDSDDDGMYRQSACSLDDTIVMEAKEKGKELYSNLSLPDRKKTLDDMVTKLQYTIDKESEYKSEMLKNLGDTTDPDRKRIISQQLEKCDEKMEALMMMMVHYCSGLQHCLDQEEAHKRLNELEEQNQTSGNIEDTGIQFIVTEDQSNGHVED